jgi:multidrug efflux pump subunit AcrA (membrane-fusion protein)
LERARLLTALHPCLASEPFEPDFLPSELLDWLAAVRELPLECSFAALCEGLREREPVAVAALERDAAQGQALALELPLEEARAEFSGALSQLKSRAIRAEIDALVAKGSLSESDRERLRLLQAFRIRA